MTHDPHAAADSALTIAALLGVLTARQEDLHWAVTTGAALLAALAASLAIYRHLRAIWRRRG